LREKNIPGGHLGRARIVQSRGDRLAGFAEADESDSRFAVGHAFLAKVWIRRGSCGALLASLPQMIAGLLQVCYMVRNPALAPHCRGVISRIILGESS
jgi:hypothetical protein